MDPESGCRRAQPGGSFDLAIEEGGRHIRPQHREHESRDSGATAEIQVRSGIQCRCPGRGMVDVAFHRFRAEKPQTAGILENGTQGAEIGHAGRITTCHRASSPSDTVSTPIDLVDRVVHGLAVERPHRLERPRLAGLEDFGDDRLRELGKSLSTLPAR